MWEEILKAFSGVYLPSMLKFFLGPLSGYALKLNLATTILSTVAGMMTVVLGFAFAGDWIKKNLMNRFFPNRKKNIGQQQTLCYTMAKVRDCRSSFSHTTVAYTDWRIFVGN
jgi:hypothetical protein